MCVFVSLVGGVDRQREAGDEIRGQSVQRWCRVSSSLSSSSLASGTNERERENWKVADWTEEDEQMMSGATYEWIRMDADYDWIAAIGFDQPDFMWISQLQRDRDVVAQLEVSTSSPACLSNF